MSTYHFGRAGLVLLAVYVFLEALVESGSSVRKLAEGFASSGLTVELVFVSIAMVVIVVVLFGALPAFVLIRNSAGLARRWFADDDQPRSELDAHHLLQVGVLVLGLATALGGALGLVGALSTVAFSTFAFSDGVGARTGVNMSAMAGGSAVASLVRLAVGLVLIRFAKLLSDRWLK